LDYARQRLQSACAKQQSAGVRSGQLPFWKIWSYASADPFDRSDEVENPSRRLHRRVFLIVQWSERPLISIKTNGVDADQTRIIPDEDGWGGWLGRYQAALRQIALKELDRVPRREKAGAVRRKD
jgi:hypothetical protein